MLRGRRALITGATAGLGLAVAESLAAAGCDLVINGLAEAEAAEAARAGLEARFGVRALFHGADLARPAEIEDLLRSAEAALGGVDILVNNAVVRHFAPVEELPAAQWDEALAVNLSAAFHAIRLALPGMRRRNWGRIVNMASVYSFRGAENRVGYITTKSALLGLTRAVALETAGSEITCNAVCPGTLPTPAIVGRIRGLAEAQGIEEAEAARRYLAERQPSGRFVAMENVGALVAFLCGPAGRDITGAALPIDGGWTAA